MLDIITSCNPVQYQGNLLMQIWENEKKTWFWTLVQNLTSCRILAEVWAQKNFLQVLPVLDVRYCRKLIIVCNFKERVWSKLNKMAKNRILDLQIRAANFFFKNLASLVTKYHGQLSSCTISDKTNDPILKSLSSDRRTDGREWFHRTLSN